MRSTYPTHLIPCHFLIFQQYLQWNKDHWTHNYALFSSSPIHIQLKRSHGISFPVIAHLYPTFLLQYDWPHFTPKENKGKRYNFLTHFSLNYHTFLHDVKAKSICLTSLNTPCFPHYTQSTIQRADSCWCNMTSQHPYLSQRHYFLFRVVVFVNGRCKSRRRKLRSNSEVSWFLFRTSSIL